MGTPFTKDMNIITNFLKDMDIIAALDDQPNDVGGLTAAELKAKFDEGGKAIQSYINDTLIPEVVGLDATEAERKAAETIRLQSEAARVTAEQGRVQAEEARVAADAERDHAEYLRQSGETGRIQGENTRRTQEAGRAREELARVDAEMARVQAETARADAEALRVTAEGGRKSAETARTSAEALRVEVESARRKSEENRAVAENQRRIAEASRSQAETARAEAEAQRVDSTAGIVAQATEQAQAAAASAATAVQSAETAAAGGEQAAASAQTAAADAATAKTAADAAQSWAVGGTGTRPDEDLDNAKYWASVAHAAAGGGVVTFNGRTGPVMPQAGDYTADMVGAASLGPDGKVPDEQLPELRGTRMCRIVVGSAADGWTEKDCDYLCDGVDDQMEIQAAIDALPESGGEIHLLEGSYNLTGQFTLTKPDVTIRGTAGATRLYAAYDITGMHFFLQVNADRCTLSGLWMSMGEGFYGGMACGVEVSANEVVLENLDIRNFMLTAVGVNNTAADCSIRFCRTSAQGGMAVSGPRCTIYGCFVGKGGLLNYGEESLMFCNRIQGMNSTVSGAYSVATNNVFDASSFTRAYGVYVGNVNKYGRVVFVGNLVKANKSGRTFSVRVDGNENLASGNVLVGYGLEDAGSSNYTDGNLVATGGESDGV